MNAMELAEAYRKDPCAVLSIPYWKSKQITVPENMRIVHDRDFVQSEFIGYSDEPYFRLYHSLKNIRSVQAEDVCMVTAKREDIPRISEIINRSYDDLSVTCEQLQGYTKTEVYRPELWIMAVSRTENCAVGCGIAEFDREMREGMIEWVQVLPEFRNKGIGSAIVDELLGRMSAFAEFATVSGKVNNPTKPENLYRRCGFTGKDVWHVLKK